MNLDGRDISVVDDYKIINPVRKQIWNDFEKPIKENEKLFNDIKNHYLTFINNIYSFSAAK